jgi:hypothetical protein
LAASAAASAGAAAVVASVSPKLPSNGMPTTDRPPIAEATLGICKLVNGENAPARPPTNRSA